MRGASKLIWAALLAAPALALAQTNMAVYSNSLVNGWQDTSYNCAVNYATPSPVYSGSGFSVSATIGAVYGGIQMSHAPMTNSGFGSISFWLNGGASGGQFLKMYGTLGTANGAQAARYFLNMPASNTWQQYTVSLSSLGVANATNFTGFAIQDAAAISSEPTFYLDDIQLVNSAAAPPALPQLTVNAGQSIRTADARWFAINTPIWDSNLDTPETLTLLTNMGVQALRFPGGSGSDQFNWLSNADVVVVDPWKTTLASFIQVVTNLNAQAMITLNYGSGTSNEAAAWVAYVNAETNNTRSLGVDSTGFNWQTAGYWASLRAAAPLAADDGENFLRISQPAPLGFKYWEIGNEVYGSWETDQNSPAHDPYTYAVRSKGYISLMKAVDSTIKIGEVVIPGVSNYVNNTSHPAVDPVTKQTNYGWTPVVLATLASLGVTPDFAIYHNYPENPGSESDHYLLASSSGWASAASDLRSQINDYLGANGAGVELVCTENNSISSNPGKQSVSLVNGLYKMDSLAQLMQTEFNGLFWWDLRNGAVTYGNMSSALYGWREYGDYGTVSQLYPTYYTTELMTNFAQAGDTVVAAATDYSLLSVYAARRQDGSLTVLVINKDPVNTNTGQIAVAGFTPASTVAVYSYGIPQDTAAETGTGSPDIAQTSIAVTGTNITYAFPPYSATVIALSPAPVLLQDQFGYITNTDDTNTITLTNYTGPGDALAIPTNINGLTVTGIGANAFYSAGVTSVTIPNGVTCIGDDAFYKCYALTNVVIPGSVVNIGEDAFQFCTNLANVAISSSVTNIGAGAFVNCSSLMAITVDAANTFYSSGDGVLFDKDQSTLIQFPGGLGGNYTIPSSVTNFGEYPFLSCAHLASVIIPGSATSLPAGMFEGCTGLTNATLSNGVTSIGNEAFQYCSSLPGIAIPASVTDIGFEAFQYCASLTAITVTAPNSYYSSLNGVLFDESQTTLIEYPGGLGGSYTVPGSVISIASSAFAGCSNLTGIGFPSGLTNIGADAFLQCTGLINVIIPNGLVNIQNGTFLGCSQLESFTIAASVTNLGAGALAQCSSLTSIFFLGNAPTGDPTVFAFDNGPTVYYLSGTTGWSNTFAGVGAVPTTEQNQSQFTCTTNAGVITITGYTGPGGAVTIPSSINSLTVTSIGSNAFENFTNLTGVTIPSSVTSIGAAAFAFCTGLTNVTIPQGVTSIGQGAFYGCANLASVTIPSSVTNLGEYGFQGCDLLTNITIANGVTSIGEYAFYGCGGLTSITLPVSVTNIEADAFESCPDLNSVYFAGNAPAADATAFNGDPNATAYYSPGTSGWSNTLAGLPAAPELQSQFSGTVTNGAITITGYTGPSGAVTIPTTIGSLSVASIGYEAFYGYANLTSVTIPSSVISIGASAFSHCTGLTNVTISPGVASIGQAAFYRCSGLTSISIPSSVTNIGGYAFQLCDGLTNVNLAYGITSVGDDAFYGSDGLISVPLPASVTNIGKDAFAYCTGLTRVAIPSSVNTINDYAYAWCANLANAIIPASVTNIGYGTFTESTQLAGVYFLGNAPSIAGLASDGPVFYGDNSVTVYYLPGATGWSNTFQGVPALLWNPLIQTSGAGFGVNNNQFGFNIAGTASIPIVVEACTNLVNPVWTPLTNVLLTNGLFHFSEPMQANRSSRYYRVSSP